MLKFYLSGATSLDVEQKDINKSIGGYKSNTPIPNGRLNSIFSSISSYNIKNKDSVNVIGLFLTNDGDNPINNILIENFYPIKNGEYTNLADFEISVVEPTENGSIELIGSIFEEPFYIDWFDCESRFEDCIIEVKNHGLENEEIFIFNEIGTLTGNDLESTVNDLVRIINQNENLSAESIGENKIYIKNNILEYTDLGSNFVTDGICELVEDKNLSNFKNGKTLIYDSLEPGKSIGIWFKRKINDNYDKIKPNCDVDLETEVDIELKEKIIFNFLFDDLLGEN